MSSYDVIASHALHSATDWWVWGIALAVVVIGGLAALIWLWRYWPS